jgi:hypothetical protein
MKHMPQTLMEMINHLVINHPELAPTIETIAANAQAKTVYVYTDWEQRNFDTPIPEFIKRSRLLYHGVPGAAWVETGTYIGGRPRC